jgi:hypothetical protein
MPQAQDSRRAPRVRFAETTPAVVRLQNGWRVHGKLQVISVTGGLLCLSKLLNQGSRVKLMFLTQTGPVLGAAEMLSPVPSGSQPFRFTTLFDDDRRRLQAAIQLSQDQNRRDHQQIEMHRAW